MPMPMPPMSMPTPTAKPTRMPLPMTRAPTLATHTPTMAYTNINNPQMPTVPLTNTGFYQQLYPPPYYHNHNPYGNYNPYDPQRAQYGNAHFAYAQHGLRDSRGSPYQHFQGPNRMPQN